MLKFILVGVIMLSNVIFVCGDAPVIGYGEWKIYYVSYLEGRLNEIIIDLKQNLINRTHYVYNGEIVTHEPLDEMLGIKLDICKYVDGGCKQYQVMSDDSFITFVDKWAGEYVEDCFKELGIEPAKFPLDKGEVKVKNFIFNIAKLPKHFTYGRYIAEACAMRGTMACGCITCECEFYEAEEDDDDDDDCDEDCE